MKTSWHDLQGVLGVLVWRCFYVHGVGGGAFGGEGGFWSRWAGCRGGVDYEHSPLRVVPSPISLNNQAVEKNLKNTFFLINKSTTKFSTHTDTDSTCKVRQEIGMRGRMGQIPRHLLDLILYVELQHHLWVKFIITHQRDKDDDTHSPWLQIHKRPHRQLSTATAFI